MSEINYVYPKPRPDLTVEHMGGRKLGNCYSATNYRVTSQFKLTRDKLLALRDLGFLGMGQDFQIHSKCDGTETTCLTVPAACVAMDSTGKPIPGPAINPYSGKPYEPTSYTYYVYEVETRCDSSD